MNIPDIDWTAIAINLLHVGVAYVLALPVAWDRERQARGAGLRTFPPVAIASCGYLLIVHKAYPNNGEIHVRMLAGLMSGVGFIGGGAILKLKDDIKGVATAASIWATGAIGGAVAFGSYEIAIVISLATFLTLRFMTPIKEKIEERDSDEDSGTSTS